jgi:hypothetical protein
MMSRFSPGARLLKQFNNSINRLQLFRALPVCRALVRARIAAVPFDIRTVALIMFPGVIRRVNHRLARLQAQRERRSIRASETATGWTDAPCQTD